MLVVAEQARGETLQVTNPPHSPTIAPIHWWATNPIQHFIVYSVHNSSMCRECVVF